MELRDHSQNIVVGGEVNVTFFVADTHHERILARETAKNGCSPDFRIASLRAMSCLKAVIASSRSSSRDWFDLYVLEKERGFGIAEWKTASTSATLGG